MNDWLTAHDVAERMGIPYTHLWTYQSRGQIPEPDQHFGNKPMWKQETVESWQFKGYKPRSKATEDA
jgi:hypothetical protein